MMHSSILKGRVGRGALSLALLAGAVAVFLMTGGLGEGQETQTCPDDTVCVEYPENRSGTVVAYSAIDPEGEEVMWSLPAPDGGANVDVDLFEISDTGALTFKTPPDYENAEDDGPDNVYLVTIQVRDAVSGAPLSDEPRPETRAVRVEVMNVEEPGEVTLSTLQPQEEVAVTATLTDPDEYTLTTGDDPNPTWQWSRSTRETGSWTDIKGATSSSYTPVTGHPADAPDNYASDVGMYLRATATYIDGHCDPCEPKKTAYAVSAYPVRAKDYVNEAPVFKDAKGNDLDDNDKIERSVAENSPAGTAVGAPVKATDLGNDGLQEILTYTLGDSGDKTNFDIDHDTGQIRVKDALDHEDEDSYTVTVTATDPSHSSSIPFQDNVDVVITVTDIDEDPMITEGPIAIDYLETDDTLDAEYEATDPEYSDPGALKWSLTGPDAARFAIGNRNDDRGELTFREHPDFEAPTDSGRDNVYNVTVTVTDLGGNTATKDVTVKVANAAEDGFFTLSNLDPRVGVRITPTLADPDMPITNETWTWTLDSKPQPPSATYTPRSGDNDKRLSVQVSYHDGTGERQCLPGCNAYESIGTIANKKTGTNQSPSFTGASTRMTVQENKDAGEEVGQVTANDDDDLTYSINRAAMNYFSIDQGTGEITTTVTLDREKQRSYRVTVTAEDPSGLRGNLSLTIEVTDVNEPPEFTAGDFAVYYAENGRGSAATYRAADPEGRPIRWDLAGTDASDFSISRSGVLTFRQTPNHEVKDEYSITVEARADGSDDFDSEVVSIIVTNVDETGEITFSQGRPQEDVELTVSIEDPDGDVSEESWQWARASSRTGRYTDIENAKAATYEPGEDDVGNYLRVTAAYSDPEGPGKSAQYTFRSSTLREAYENTDPVFQNAEGQPITTNAERSIEENAKPGANVGDPVKATDIGSTGRQERLTYKLGGNDQNRFSIVISTGQLRVAPGITLNFERIAGEDDNCAVLNECVVTVTATDPDGKSSTPMTVEIAILDVDETPEFGVYAEASPTVNVTSVSHAEFDDDETDSRKAVANYTATDEDTKDTDSNRIWSLAGTDADDFAISAMGALTFKDEPDYEAPTNSRRNNIYDVTVTVTDMGGNTVSKKVKVTVTNVEEDGSISLSHTHPEVGARLTATLTDPDRPTGRVTWQWYTGTRGDGDLAIIPAGDPGAGEIRIVANADGSVAEGDDKPNACSADTPTKPCSIPGATSSTYIPKGVEGAEDEEDIGNVLTVRASYRDGEGTSKTALFTTGTSNLVQPKDVNNVKPHFEDDEEMPTTRTSLEIAEREASVSDETVGIAVTAMDDDTNDTEQLFYLLSGRDAAPFTIDSNGQIKTKAALDYETKRTYSVIVTAVDPSGASARITVTINVTDVDEVPELSEKGLVALGSGIIGYEENGREAVAEYRATGPNAGSVRWSLAGVDASDFSISSGGRLTFRSVPNFESPADSDRDNRYEITVVARAGSVRDELDVTVDVLNADEEGAVALSPTRVNVGARITATLTDPDGTTSQISWDWGRSRNGTSGWSVIPGAISRSYIPTTEDGGYYLRATAVYTDPEGAEKSAGGRTSGAVLVDDDGVVTLSTERVSLGDRVTVRLTDPDGNVRNVSWQWASSSSRTSGWLDIPGATSSTYTVVAADLGNFLRATVRYDDGDGLDKSAEAVSTTVVVEDDDGVVTLSSSSPMVGETVTATLTDPDGGVTGAAWQWASSTDGRSNWTNIARANSRTYTVAAGDVGSYLRATVIYDDAAGAGKGAEEVTAAAVTEDDDGSVTLSPSSPEVGERVTAVLSDPDGGVTNRTWRWHISSNGTSSWTIVLGATSSTFAVTETHVGRYLRATASYTDAVGSGKSAEAVTTAAVAPDDDGRATLSETMPTAGDTVTARIDDPDGGVTGETWQWHISPNGASNWVIILGATSSSYTATTANVGSYLRATASYTDSVGPGKSANAVTAAAVAEDDDGRVTLSTRTPEVGSAIRASLSDPDGGVTGEMWQWAKSSNGSTGWTDIPGATSGSYTPGESDAGIFLRATVSYDDAVGTGKGAQAATSSGVAQMELLSEYDANRNESIERNEAIRAVSDYFDGEISKDDVLAVLVLYFSG